MENLIAASGGIHVKLYSAADLLLIGSHQSTLSRVFKYKYKFGATLPALIRSNLLTLIIVSRKPSWLYCFGRYTCSKGLVNSLCMSGLKLKTQSPRNLL